MEKLEGCPICGNEQSKLFLECEDYTVSRETFTIQECGGCNFRFTNPRPNENEIGPYYKSEAYISHTNSGKGIVNTIYKQVRKYTLAKKFKLVSGLVKGNSILDYGSGAGAFLNHCKQNNWKVKGVEADHETRERVVKEFDLEILTPGQISTLKKQEFDVITLWHVLEHVHQLKDTIGALRDSLKNDGALLIAVPNCDSFDAGHYGREWAAYDVPRHIYHFRPSDIANLFSGIDMVVERTMPMVFDAYYVSMLSEKHGASTGAFIKGMWNGLMSNIKGDPEKSYSSQIYILRKNKAI
jgi:2-polyprenyl-3-methyl-5-hydroxy-6-metoxy-1,4-benzoquinol methylase